MPPTEKRGRWHTSTITVAVLPAVKEYDIALEGEVEIKTTRGSGAGGQHRNVTDSAVVLTHLPTNIRVRCESERSQPQNKRKAFAILAARLRADMKERQGSQREALRRSQVGSGQRGDKIRTVSTRAKTVTNNKTGTKLALSKYLQGHIELIQ